MNMTKQADFKIRSFKTEDYNSLIELWKGAGLPYKPNGRDSKKTIESELKKGIAIFFVAEKNDRIIGFCYRNP